MSAARTTAGTTISGRVFMAPLVYTPRLTDRLAQDMTAHDRGKRSAVQYALGLPPVASHSRASSAAATPAASTNARSALSGLDGDGVNSLSSLRAGATRSIQ